MMDQIKTRQELARRARGVLRMKLEAVDDWEAGIDRQDEVKRRCGERTYLWAAYCNEQHSLTDSAARRKLR